MRVGNVEQCSDECFHRFGSRARRDHPQRIEAGRCCHRVSANCGDNGVEERFANRDVHLDHHAEIEQHDTTRAVNEQVARMRIGVKDTIAQHHAGIALDERFDEHTWRDFAARDAFVELVDASPFDVLEHEDIATSERSFNPRNHQSRFVRKAFAHARALRTFAHEVHLLPHVKRELVEHDAKAVHMMVRKTAVDPFDNPTGNAYVARNDLLDMRSQHLHHDLAPLIARTVHLPERTCRKRHGIERVEYRIGIDAPRALNRGADCGPRHRRHLVGERAECAEVRLGDKVGAGSKDLREFDEGRAERRDRIDERSRATFMECRVAYGRRAPTNPSPMITSK